MKGKNTDDHNENQPYTTVFVIGVLYVLLLGLFTFLFNNPV